MSIVKLISITSNAEAIMAYIARVSSPHQDSSDYAKLLGYCIRHKHWSVFEHAYLTVEIETSRAIARQILRHKSMSFSEFSQRYSEVNVSDMILNEARFQDPKNRQASHDILPSEIKADFDAAQQEVWKIATEAYTKALDSGIAKECARALLPEGLTSSRLYMSGSVRSFLHYIDLRSANGTQKEHQEIAVAIRNLLIDALPTVSTVMQWVTQ